MVNVSWSLKIRKIDVLALANLQQYANQSQVENCWSKLVLSTAGMHSVRPGGQMWPAEAFNLARKAQNFLLSPCLIEKTPFEWEAQIKFGPWIWLKFVWAVMRFELCIPDLQYLELSFDFLDPRVCRAVSFDVLVRAWRLNFAFVQTQLCCCCCCWSCNVQMAIRLQ